MHTIQKQLLALSRNVNLGEKSLREIGKLISVSHPQKVKHHLEVLEKKGFIVVDRARNMIVNINSDKKNENIFINVPIVGSANCGPAELLAVENIEGYVKISKRLVPKASTKRLFIVKARGNSMNKALINGKNIDEGDYVVIDGESFTPKNGDYVLSVIDGAANLKKFGIDRKSKMVILQSESHNEYPPIYIHPEDFDGNFMINGKIVDVLKKPGEIIDEE